MPNSPVNIIWHNCHAIFQAKKRKLNIEVAKMKNTITAVFESADAAELALMDINRASIPVLEKNIHPITEFERKRDIFHLAPIYATRRLEDERQSQVTLSPFKVIPPYKSHRLYRDVVSNDTVLELKVADYHVDMARQKLISHHAHWVNQI